MEGSVQTCKHLKRLHMVFELRFVSVLTLSDKYVYEQKCVHIKICILCFLEVRSVV